MSDRSLPTQDEPGREISGLETTETVVRAEVGKREHEIEIVSSFLTYGYFAACSCGWSGVTCGDQVTALVVGRDHQRDHGQDT